MDFARRLAALAPRPRLQLFRFHGVLAPNAKLRALVVPQGPLEQEGPTVEAAAAAECEPAEFELEPVQAMPHCIGWPSARTASRQRS